MTGGLNLLSQSDARQKSALSLAYLGDAVYETLVREYLTEQSDASTQTLHNLAVSVVCAKAQSEAFEMLIEHLTEEEQAVARRGKNASKASVPRSATPKSYRAATALEALFGYLAMTRQDERLRRLFNIISESQIDGELKAARGAT